MEFVGWALILAVLWGVYKAMQDGWRSEMQARPHMRGDGRFALEVVGESSYTEALEAILGDAVGSEKELKREATLVLEDDNPHDTQAVRVDVQGVTVGYLARAMAPVLRRSLAAANAGAHKRFTCDALVYAGGRARRYSVRLDLVYRE